MLKHIVFWKIAENGSAEERAALIDEFRAKIDYLKTLIPQLANARIGANTVEGSYHVCIDSCFENKESLDEYIEHPEHLKVRAWLDSISYDKAVFDYYYEE